MSNPARVILVDGSSLIYRAFFALPLLSTPDGLHTNAIYGFATMFKKVLAGRTPTYGAVVFDPPGKTARHEEYADYKATRERMPDELREQLPWIDRVVEANGFPLLRVPGHEADDVIATLTQQALDAGHEVFLISGDKDFAQLIGERVRMVDTMRDVTYDPELVRKKWGVRPDQIVDYLALLGDKSDNVPGVPGIGAKGASQLLEEHGSLAAILAKADTLKGRAKKALTEHKEQALLSQKLVTLNRALELPLGLADLELPAADPAPLTALYRELGFNSLLGADDQARVGGGEGTYAALTDPAEVARVLEALGAQGPVTVYAIPAAEPPAHSPLVGLALAGQPGTAYYVPLDAPGHSVDLAAPAWAPLRAFLGDPARPKVGHDLKRVMYGLLRRADLTLQGAEFDTRLASFLIDPTKLVPHRLDQVSKEFLQQSLTPWKEVAKAGKQLRPLSEVPLAELTPWACQRADAVCALVPKVRAALEAAGQDRLLVEHELPLSAVLARMEVRGVGVDVQDLQALGQEFGERLAGYERRIFELAGHPFNVNSTKQLSEVLFEELKLPVIKKTKTGYSTKVEVLERLAKEHEIARQLLEFRKLAKLINTYTDVLQREADPVGQRVRCTFQQTAGATGRLITTQPDLQRTPIKTPEGERIRRAFVAPPGQRMISADWSQIELRILAHMSADPLLCAAFAESRDVHRQTAAELFGCAQDAVTPDQRRIGKTVNFATIYGQGATALGQILDVPRKDAKAYIERFFAAYAGVRAWLDRTIEAALETGYVTTYLGRRRAIPELKSKNTMIHEAGKRIAANTPIQGSAADLCKLVMLDLPQRFAREGLETAMVLQIHDELLFESPEAEVEAARAQIRASMETVAELRVPLLVDVGVGHTWAEAHG
ncbi:MAG: DNA polymerase I [Planctomycetes bacterium]|nr:DNA polymerase I [Planctomycetota bacterium]